MPPRRREPVLDAAMHFLHHALEPDSSAVEEGLGLREFAQPQQFAVEAASLVFAAAWYGELNVRDAVDGHRGILTRGPVVSVSERHWSSVNHVTFGTDLVKITHWAEFAVPQRGSLRSCLFTTKRCREHVTLVPRAGEARGGTTHVCVFT